MLRAPMVLIALIAVCLAQGQYKGAKPVPSQWSSGFKTINVEDATSLLTTLAGPSFIGRSPDSLDFAAAAGFCAGWYQRWGLEPAGPDGSYFQPFTLQKVRVVKGSMQAPGAPALEMKKDFVLGAPQNFAVQMKLAFLRVPPGANFPDLDLESLKNTVVIVHPETRDSAGAKLRAFQGAVRKGAASTIVISPSSDALPLEPPVTTLVKEAPPQREFVVPTVRLTTPAVAKLAAFLGATGYLAEKPSGASFEPTAASFTLEGTVESEVLLKTFNVVAKVEGSDPVLRRQAVVVGSHLDHLGKTDKGTFWGADDNASGSTANLMAARAVAQNRVKPRRTVIFALWSCEEKGLWGSWMYANNPAVPIPDTVAYLNMDMVGRDSMDARWNDQAENNRDAIYAASSKTYSPDLYALIHEANRYVGLRLRDDREDTTFRSDTMSFASKDVPILKAFTGEHPDYHKVTDTPDKINFSKLANIARWIYLSAEMLASADARPRFVEGSLLMGKVVGPDKAVLPADAEVEVKLIDASSNPPVVLDKTTITLPGQMPVRFGVRYAASELKASGIYHLRAEVRHKGKVLYQSEPVRVLGQGADPDVVVDVPIHA